ncbi:MAG: glycine cleavage system aminomethyltransferase GcvT [Pseudomonadota bacterium]
MTDLKILSLDGLHQRCGGKMVSFAGYSMPVQFPMGVKAEHLHVRTKAGLFDVSHMGQAFLSLPETGGETAHQEIAAIIETLVPGEIQKLGKGRIRYTVLLNDEGGILDDLMVTRLPGEEEAGRLFLVVNAAVKAEDFAYINEKLAGRAQLEVLDDRSLLAVQGPTAHLVVDELFPGAAELSFMSMMEASFEGTPVYISRCGYTGEDGYEVSIPSGHVEVLAEKLLANPEVEPIGLGARDSLRLEAGLCLYGHDMTPAQTPVEASLTFALGKRRRKEGGFPGAALIQEQLKNGTSKQRVGIKPLGRAPAREGVEIQSVDGAEIGIVTSGSFGPTFGGPIAMGYVSSEFAAAGTKIHLIVRGKVQEAEVVDLPFVEQRYYRGKKSA